MRQFSGVRDLGAGDRPNLLGRHRNDRSRPAGEGDKLDLVSLMAWINMNDRSNIARLKPLLGKRHSQNDSIMFANHIGTLLEGMGRDQPWFVCSAIDDPDSPNRRGAPVRANDRPLDSVFGAIPGHRHRGDRMSAGVDLQCLRQDLPSLDRKTEVSKKLRLAGPFGMLGSQKVINDLGFFDTSVGGVRKIHYP